MILTNEGHKQIANFMNNKEFWLAWGTTSSPWDVPPPENIDSLELENEVGRVKELVKKFVIPDDDGQIELNKQKWAISEEPTKYIYLKFVFDEDKNPNEKIYQLGIFEGTVPTDDAAGKTYLSPSEIKDKGKLIFIENIMAINRNDVTKEIFEFVVTF